MALLRKILFPFSLLYALIIRIRNWLFDTGILKSATYDFPLICVGNLSVGGTGKTPMSDYLIGITKKRFRIAILSRGYKRKSRGFVRAGSETSVQELGDEPFQYHLKHNDITVAVDADRRRGITNLMNLDLPPEGIILDDAFQHRNVKAGCNILLSVYNDLYINDFMLPTGNLRDNRREARRADIIVITKCPDDLSVERRDQILKKIKPLTKQKVYFSTIKYKSHFIGNDKTITIDELKGKSFVLVTGIAKPSNLVDHLRNNGLDFKHLNFNDHHDYTQKELESLRNEELVLTTEKDYTKLYTTLNNLFYVPIEISFLFGQKSSFDDQIISFIGQKKSES